MTNAYHTYLNYLGDMSVAERLAKTKSGNWDECCYWMSLAAKARKQMAYWQYQDHYVLRY
jgi:hypothetical protein